MKKISWPLIAVAAISVLSVFAVPRGYRAQIVYKQEGSGYFFLIQKEYGQPGGWDCEASLYDTCRYLVKAGIWHSDPFTRSEVNPDLSTVQYRYCTIPE